MRPLPSTRGDWQGRGPVTTGKDNDYIASYSMLILKDGRMDDYDLFLFIII